MELGRVEDQMRSVRRPSPTTPRSSAVLPGPGTMPTGPAQLLALQRFAGNRAVAGYVAAGAPALSRQPAVVPQAARDRPAVAGAVATVAPTDGRGLEADEADDRLTSGLIGAGIGGGIGALAGGLLGGPLGALAGGLAGAAIGGGIGALAGGGPSAPVPIAVRNGPGHRPIDTATAAGMSIDITLTSSSGVDADMAAVQDSEQVGSSINHTGSYTTVPAGRSSNSGYMPGHPIPPDRHSEPKSRIIDLADNQGGNGTMDREQLDTFTAPAAGIITPQAIPSSGYLIRRIVTVNGTEIKFRLEKSPRAVTVNGFTTTAGPSPLQSDEVTVRP